MRTAFIDVDTQNDFMLPSGALYVPGAERLIPTIAKLNAHAAARGIPLISTADAHAENDPEFRVWPAHCIRGTFGQQKPPATLVKGQIIIEKQHNDVFTNPRFEQMLATLEIERCIVFGVVTEICVKCAAMGLLKIGKRVELVTDGLRSLSDDARDAMMREFTEAGGTTTTAHAMLSL